MSERQGWIENKGLTPSLGGRENLKVLSTDFADYADLGKRFGGLAGNGSIVFTIVVCLVASRAGLEGEDRLRLGLRLRRGLRARVGVRAEARSVGSW